MLLGSHARTGCGGGNVPGYSVGMAKVLNMKGVGFLLGVSLSLIDAPVLSSLRTDACSQW